MSYLSDVKLKPCPLCGAAFLIAQEPYDNPPVAGMYYIFHDYGPLGSDARECPIDVSRHFNTREEAIAAWNRRPAEAERDDLLAKNGALASLEQGYADAADKAGKEKWVREGGLAKGQWQARAEAAEATVSRLTAENEKMREALKPFAEFGRLNVDENGWKSNIHREGLSVWFGPSEFRAAWVSHKALGGKDE